MSDGEGEGEARVPPLEPASDLHTTYGDLTHVGRVVSITRTVGLGDVRTDATARLDTLACIIQDVADADAASAPIDGMGVWILRALALRIDRQPGLRDEIVARTWCSGIGRQWAERRTQLDVAGVRCVDATALWVHTDPERGVPVALPAGFAGVWGPTTGGRTVSARLRHEGPPPDGRRSRWPLRAVDLDVLDHVNNAAYWAMVEEELARRGRPRVQRADIEFRGGLRRDDDVEVQVAERDDGFASWFTVDGDVRASVLVGCGP